MKVLKAICIFILCAILTVAIFAAVLGIASLINGVGFYEQGRLWFGSASEFAKFLKGGV